jgi:hypothetical protein
MNIKFEQLSNEEHQIKALYDLLSKRNHSISHQQMPSYAQHNEFVKNHPYRSWYLLKHSQIYIGSFYVTYQNTVGINILDDFISKSLSLIIQEVKAKFAPLPSIKSVRSDSFSVNVAPDNLNLIAELERCGCLIAQVNYLIK